MSEETACAVERALLLAGCDIADLIPTLTASGVRGLNRDADRRLNTVGHVQACLARIEACVNAIRSERRRKL